jgi:alcohol dehydrogenase YqhD (iron-dependent ADH family)
VELLSRREGDRARHPGGRRPDSARERVELRVGLNNAERGEKLLTSLPAIRPLIAFMNPGLTCSLLNFVTACGIVDIGPKVLNDNANYDYRVQ